MGMFGLPRPTSNGFYNEGFWNNTCIVDGAEGGVSGLQVQQVCWIYATDKLLFFHLLHLGPIKGVL
jgi:hypothetical protein